MKTGCLLLTIVLLIPSNSCLAADRPSVEGRVKIFDRNGKVKRDHGGVIVFLDEMEHAPAFSPPEENAVVDQVNKRFIPKVLPILVGTTVDFPNNDTIFHNVFSLSRAKKFDLGIYKQRSSKSVTFDQTGLIKVYCNIHPQMIAYILVLANPYFTVTDQDGHFIFSNAPLGKVTVRTWNPRSRRHPERKIVVTDQGIRNLDLTVKESDIHFEVREESISIKHKNKWGQDYPAKY